MIALWWRLVRFGFRLLYYEIAWTYDIVSSAVSLGQWRTWQQASLCFLPSERLTGAVLELAHGTADLQLDLAASASLTVGIDLSPYMGRIAQRKLLRHESPFRLARATAFRLPFANEAFSAVVTTFPTDFFVQPETLAEVQRVLIPGGRYIIVPNGMLKLSGFLPRLLEWLYEITGQRGPWHEAVRQLLTDGGFTATVYTQDLPRSIVWIIVAEKPYGDGVRAQ